ncbi:MAG: diguanylate cyclase (GGDEF)-like protein [Candidatus Omnitrophota bacterium]
MFAVFVDQSFFFYLSLILFICLIYLILMRRRLVNKYAADELRRHDLKEQINLIQADIDSEHITIDSFRKKIVNSSQLKGLTERLSMCLYLEDTSKVLSSEVNQLFGDEDTTVILYHFQSKTGELGISSSKKGQMSVNIKSKNGDIYDEWLIKTMKPLLIEDTHSDFRFDSEKIDDESTRNLRSLISAPLVVDNKALGVLRVDSTKEHKFTTEELRFLQTIGDLGAVAIENAQLFEHVEKLAIKDSLTGLYLRKYLFDRMPQEIARHLKSKSELSFMMLDLDKFKQYNDDFGHTAGDIVLRTVGLLLSDFFDDPGRLVCRYGGEEFCVLIPDCSKEKALELADAIRKKIAMQTIILRRKQTNVTVSIGISTFPNDAQMKDDLIQKADKALYKAKAEGRNRVCNA